MFKRFLQKSSVKLTDKISMFYNFRVQHESCFPSSLPWNLLHNSYREERSNGAFVHSLLSCLFRTAPLHSSCPWRCDVMSESWRSSKGCATMSTLELRFLNRWHLCSDIMVAPEFQHPKTMEHTALKLHCVCIVLETMQLKIRLSCMEIWGSANASSMNNKWLCHCL